MASWIKSLVTSDTESEISSSEVREKNAQIGDRVFVDGDEVFQDPVGAPVEQASPLGYHVGWFGILFLNVSQMVGTGVFSTRTFANIPTPATFILMFSVSWLYSSCSRLRRPKSLILGFRRSNRCRY